MIFPFVFLLTLLALAQSLRCGHNPSICPPSTRCLFQDGVDTCMSELKSQNTTLEFSNQDINYVYWTPSKDQQNMNINIFNEDNIQRILRVGIIIQDANGTGYSSKFETIIPGGFGRWWILSLSNQNFCKTVEGEYCLMVLGFWVQSSSAITLTMSVEEATYVTNLLLPIMIGVGILILIVIVLLVVCLIRKRYLREASSFFHTKHNNLDHFETYIPKQVFRQVRNNWKDGEIEGCCSVCLIDFGEKDMVRRTLCDHIFHVECMEEWCKTKLVCPMCRDGLDAESLKERRKERVEGEGESLQNCLGRRRGEGRGRGKEEEKRKIHFELERIEIGDEVGKVGRGRGNE